jgi:hypothetical protein
MTRLALALILATGCTGTPYALHAPKVETGAEAAADRCRSLSTRRTVWTVTSSVLGTTSAGAGPIANAVTPGPEREGVIIGGVVAGIVSAVAATFATIDSAQFESACALSSGSP